MVDETDENESAPASDLLLGEVLGGKYKVAAFISRGALAVVYQAVQLPIGRPVVLKVLQPNAAVLDADPYFSERFRREAATYARLTHPNTVTMFEFGEHQRNGSVLYYMALEYVQGRTLRQVMKDEGRFTAERAMDVAIQVLRSLREAHALGIVHRDLKPRNIMITDSDEGERVKVLDFGVAKVRLEPGDTSEDALTRTGTLLGSPHYMAPEQIRVGQVDGRTDIYALGCILFELLAGVPPYRGNGVIETCAAHLTRPVPTLDQAAGRSLGVLPELEAIVRRCLEKRPEDRYADVDELATSIKLLRDGADVSSLVRLGGRIPGSAPPGRSAMVWLAAVLLAFSVPTLVLAVVLVALLVVNGGGGTTTPEAAAPEPAEAAPAVGANPAPVVHRVVSVPPGAEVLRGGARVGTTPLELTDDVLAQGGAFIVRKSGYRDLEIQPDQILRESELELRLTALPAPPRGRPNPETAPDPGPEPFRPDVRTMR